VDRDRSRDRGRADAYACASLEKRCDLAFRDRAAADDEDGAASQIWRLFGS